MMKMRRVTHAKYVQDKSDAECAVLICAEVMDALLKGDVPLHICRMGIEMALDEIDLKMESDKCSWEE